MIVENYDQLVKDADAAQTKAEDNRSKEERYALSKINIINGLYTWWIEGALDLIADSYGNNIGFDSNSSATARQIKLKFYKGSEENLIGEDAAVVPNMNSKTGETNELLLRINLEEYGNVNVSNLKDGSKYLDATLAHEMTHGTMAANIRYFMYLPKMIMEGTAELTKGADQDGRYSNIETLTRDYKKSLNDNERSQTVLVKVLTNKDAVYSTKYFHTMPEYKNDSRVHETDYSIGYAMIRYFAKQCADEVSAKYIGNLTGTVTSKDSELLQANNGIVALDKGDAVSLDSAGNINAIFISDKEHIVTTPDSEFPVSIRYSGEVIAKVTGSAVVQFDKNNDYKLKITSNKESVKAEGNNLLLADGCGIVNMHLIGDNSILTIGNGDDTVSLQGNNNLIVALGDILKSDKDKFIITVESKNNSINNFTDEDDELWFDEEVTAQLQKLNGYDTVVISSAKTGDTLVVLADVTSGSKNHIVWRKDDGTTSTSIDWLLANTTPVSPNPDDTVKHKIDVPVNGNVNNTRDDVIINAVSGNNIIQNSGNNVRINGGTDKDEITNLGNDVVIEGNSENDVLSNGEKSSSMSQPTKGGNNVVMNGGAGLDLICNYGGLNVQLNGAEGADTLYNSGSNTTITGGDGDDSINNENASEVTISSGNGKDTIRNIGENVSISAGDDNDSIQNYSSNVSIDGGMGNDSIDNRDTSNVTINGGDGKDKIHLRRGSVSIIVDGGKGDDSITGSASWSTVDGGDGDDYLGLGAGGSDLKISGGNGKDTIHNIEENVSINGGTGDDSIDNENSFVTIHGDEGNDVIRNRIGNNVLINGGEGNDSIYNAAVSNTTIDCGVGDDSLSNFGSYVSISGGTGNDTIENNGSNFTILGGKGDDYIIWGHLAFNGLFSYTSGDGFDTIDCKGFYNPDSALSIAGASYSTMRSDNDFIVQVDDGSITLKNFPTRLTPNIVGTLSNTQSGGDDSQSGGDDTQSGGDDSQSGGDDTQSGGDDSQSGGNDTQSGGDDTQSGGNDTQSGGNDTQSGGNDTQSGGNDTQSGGNDTQSGGQDQTDTVRIVKNIVGLDLNYLDKVVVTDLDSLDDLIDERTVWLNFSSDSGDGFQNIDLSKSDYRQVVSLEGGNQKVTFNDTDRNVAIVGKNATGFKNIIFGNGDDVGLFFGSNAYTRATIGSGNDSILIDNNARVRLDMTKAEETSIIPYSGRVILDNYNPNSRASILFSDVNNVTGAIKDGTIKLVGDTVRSGSSSVTVNDSLNGATLVNISSANGYIQKVGFTGINGGFIDAHDLRDDLLLKGNYAENSSDKQSSKRSTLISGSGNDTILAGARDTVDAGDGRNQIYLTPYDLREKKQGANIVLSGKGRNTVHSFQEGFDYDCVQVADISNVEFKFQTDGLLLKSGDSRLKFDGIGIVETFSNSSDIPTNLDTDEPEKITLTDGKRTINAVVAQTNQSVGVTKSDYHTPNAFFGNRSGLNFSDYRGDLNINLNDGNGTLDKFNATFQGINKLQAGTGMATLIGSDNRDTLIAGDGYSSLWGGKGNDKLIGRASSTDKDGRTTFFFFAGDGHDVIYDFNFLTPQNYYSGDTDKINIGDCNINDAYCSGDDVILALDDDSYLTIKNAKEKNFQINHMIAQVGNELHYDGIANTFANNGNRSSSLIVDSSVRSAEIWLDSSHDALFFGHISTLDASAVDGRTSLVGNEFNNTIIAGQGDSSLWGGFSSSNDLLIGGNSRNTFFYCMGNGNDTIQGTNDRDFIILSDVSLDQITETSITDDSVSIRFNDGGSLQIKGTSDVTYQLADGSKYSANHQRLEWDSR